MGRYDDRGSVDRTVWLDRETDLVGAKVSRSGLLIDCYWHARSPPLSYTAILLDYCSNHWLAEKQLAIEGSSMAETLTQRGIHVVG